MLSGTFLLYLSIMLSTTFLAAQSQRGRKDGNIFFKKGYFIAAFFIHWFFIAFTRVGVDHYQYIWIIEEDAINRVTSGTEVGFNGLCVLLYRLTKNAEVCIFIIKTLSLALVYGGLYRMREKMSIGLAVGAYNAWQYFFSFCIIAHSLAIALVFYAATLTMDNKRWIWPVLLTVIASTIHNSALVMTVVVAAIYIVNKMHTRFSFAIVVILMMVAVYVLYNISAIFHFVISNVQGFEQYENYDSSGNTGSGLFNYFIFTYLFVIVLLPVIQSKMPNYNRNAIVMFYLFSLMSAIMGYYLGTARLNKYAIIFYAVSIPWFFYQGRYRLIEAKSYIPPSIQKVAWAIYVLFVAYRTLRSYSDPTTSHMMGYYALYNPFTAH